jgi:hypothetical protein
MDSELWMPRSAASAAYAGHRRFLRDRVDAQGLAGAVGSKARAVVGRVLGAVELESSIAVERGSCRATVALQGDAGGVGADGGAARQVGNSLQGVVETFLVHHQLVEREHELREFVREARHD